jgi:exodeoxyribonuclease-5
MTTTTQDPTTTVRLTRAQEQAVQAVQAWRHRADDPLFWMTGYAGTGKSTVARYAAEGGIVAFLAPTGKAAAVLRRKGADGASTIHRVLYTPKQRSSTALQQLTNMLQRAAGPLERAEIQRKLADEMERLKQPHWEYNEATWLRSADLVVVDEASMVSEKVLLDLLRTVPKVLCLGDPAQLPPVMAKSPLLDRRPDFHLEEIHRHSLDSAVLRAATYVRQHGRLPGRSDGDDYREVPLGEANWDVFRTPDQVLVSTNEARRNVNTRFRARLGLTETLCPGDRIVVLRNSYNEGLYNGTTARVVACTEDSMFPNTYYTDVLSDEGPAENISLQLQEDPAKMHRESVPATYGYALTVHKAQGSEWDHVLVWVQGKVSPAWLYTALTRASQRLTIVR